MSSGLWKRSDVPHHGWEYYDWRDLGEPTETCQMCEAQLIRYVHIMVHPDYHKKLEVGCICAGNMSADMEGAKLREKGFKALGRRRDNFLTRRWVLKYNPDYDSYLQYINLDGWHVSVWCREDGSWAGKIVDPNQVSTYSKERYGTMEQVKAAAFDAMEKMKAKQPLQV